MGDTKKLNSADIAPTTLHKIDSGTIVLNVNLQRRFEFKLIAKTHPHTDICKLSIGPGVCYIHSVTNNDDDYYPVSVTELEDEPSLTQGFNQLTLQCHNNRVCLHKNRQKIMDLKIQDLIGYMKILPKHPRSVVCEFEAPPPRAHPRKIDISTGQIKWKEMQFDEPVPHDALIGGFEDGAPVYIARVHYQGMGRDLPSLVPGRYAPSKKAVYYVPGAIEYVLDHGSFEILCGYDAEWQWWSRGDDVPAGAIAAGNYLLEEPLYIARALHNGHMLVGKHHGMYNSCCFYYNSDVLELLKGQILVSRERRTD